MFLLTIHCEGFSVLKTHFAHLVAFYWFNMYLYNIGRSNGPTAISIFNIKSKWIGSALHREARDISVLEIIAQIQIFGSADWISFDDFTQRFFRWWNCHLIFLFSNGNWQMVFTYIISLSSSQDFQQAGIIITIWRMWKLFKRKLQNIPKDSDQYLEFTSSNKVSMVN